MHCGRDEDDHAAAAAKLWPCAVDQSLRFADCTRRASRKSLLSLGESSGAQVSSKSHSAQSRSGPVESGSWVHRLERVAGGPTQRLPGRYSGERRAEGWRKDYRVRVPSHSSRWPTAGRPWSLARVMLRAIRMQRTFPARAAALSVQSRRPKPASLKAGQLFLHRRRRRVQRHGRVPWASCRWSPSRNRRASCPPPDLRLRCVILRSLMLSRPVRSAATGLGPGCPDQVRV